MKKKFVWFDDRDVLDFLKSPEGKNNFLPAISIACSPACNMSCPHCIYDSGDPNSNGLTKDEKLKVLEDAYALGTRFLQICHEGEPFIDSAVLPLLKKAKELGMKSFLYTNASEITPVIASKLYKYDVRIGAKFDSVDPKTFNQMLGVSKAEKVYQGINNLLKAGYNKPEEKNGKLYTKLGLVCTLTTINTENMEDVKGVAKFAWDNNIFFGAARLETGGRAVGDVWKKFRIPNQGKVEDFIDWCSEQTGIDYWEAQPTPYCIGVCGMQVMDNGDVWVTDYGASCDFTEPDGESFPEKIVTIGNVKKQSLKSIMQKIWNYRKNLFEAGVLDRKLKMYEATKNVYPNGLQDCGSARTYTLFVPFYEYVKKMVKD